jgi:ATP-dependent DNA helicase RecG
VSNNLIVAVDECIAFINRHTNTGAKISAIKREDVPQFPPEAVREVVINAIVHADYAMKGSTIQIAIFSDRIEFTNPGNLPFGQTIESAISGISRMRNRVIGRVFRELKLIERLGSGLPRILAIYKNKSGKTPILEEINNHFRAILFEITVPAQPTQAWEIQLLEALSKRRTLNTKEIAILWEVTARAARLRLRGMLKRNLIKREAQSKTDPKATYTINRNE